MAEGAHNSDNQTPPVRPQSPGEPALSLSDDGNGTAGGPVRSTPIGEPSLSLTDEREPRKEAKAPSRALSISTLQELEDRVRRLEEQYTTLRDPKVMEERVVQRVTNRLRRKPSTGIQEGLAPRKEGELPAASVAGTEEAASATVTPHPDTPLATALVAPMAVMAPTISATAVAVPAAPMAAVATPAVAVARVAEPHGKLEWLWRALVIFEALGEVRIMLRMIGDPRYRMTWLSWLVPPIFLVLFIFSDWESLKGFFPWNLVPAVGWLINKAIVLVLGFVAFKVLMSEVQRYRDTIPDAPGTKSS